MMKVGTATKIINNELGTIIQAAGHEKKAKSIRDNLEANFFYITDDKESLMFINCDVAGFESEFISETRKYISEKNGLPERGIIISGTHTHSGPSVIDTNPRREVDKPWHDRLKEWLCEGAAVALENIQNCRMGYAQGHAELAYNRRCCWKDGHHSMGGKTSLPEFTGLEGVQDSRHYVLFAENEEEKLIGIIHNNSAHATNFYGKDFYCADYPGLARKYIREGVENDITVLFFNGGFGDNSPMNFLSPYTGLESRERSYRRQAHILAGETLRLLNLAERNENPVLKHAYEDLILNVRLPDESKLEEDRKQVELARKGEADIKGMDLILAHGRVLLWDNYKENPVDTVPIHAIRVGDSAIVTNPCEMFGQFMVDVRRRSPFPITLFADITDAYCGYCPTMAGAITGGYSGEAINWTRLEYAAGYKIVDTAAKLLHELKDKD